MAIIKRRNSDEAAQIQAAQNEINTQKDNLTAADSKGVIGKGTHERFIIDNEKFMAKVNK